MRCSKCGWENQDSISRCINCRADLPPLSSIVQIPAPGGISSKALFSLISGILVLLGFPIYILILFILYLLFPTFGSLPDEYFILIITPLFLAPFLGILAIIDIRKSKGALTGSTHAIIGILLGLFGILIYIVPLSLSYLRNKSRIWRVNKEQRILETAIEAYYSDHSCFPEWGVGEKGYNSRSKRYSDFFHLPTFRIWANLDEQNTFQTLTTPMAYIENYFNDPFASVHKTTYVYYADEKGWIIISPGPDKKYDIDPLMDYDSNVPQPSPLLLEKCYDPTNGYGSTGDIYRVRRRPKIGGKR